MSPCTQSDPQGLRSIGLRAWGPHPPSPAPMFLFPPRMFPHTPSAAPAVPLGAGVTPGGVPEAWGVEGEPTSLGGLGGGRAGDMQWWVSMGGHRWT